MTACRKEKPASGTRGGELADSIRNEQRHRGRDIIRFELMTACFKPDQVRRRTFSICLLFAVMGPMRHLRRAMRAIMLNVAGNGAGLQRHRQRRQHEGAKDGSPELVSSLSDCSQPDHRPILPRYTDQTYQYVLNGPDNPLAYVADYTSLELLPGRYCSLTLLAHRCGATGKGIRRSPRSNAALRANCSLAAPAGASRVGGQTVKKLEPPCVTTFRCAPKSSKKRFWRLDIT